MVGKQHNILVIVVAFVVIRPSGQGVSLYKGMSWTVYEVDVIFCEEECPSRLSAVEVLRGAKVEEVFVRN